MARQLKPVIAENESENTEEGKKEQPKEESFKVITSEQLILNRLEYLVIAVDNLNLAISRIAKQAQFDLTKD